MYQKLFTKITIPKNYIKLLKHIKKTGYTIDKLIDQQKHQQKSTEPGLLYVVRQAQVKKRFDHTNSFGRLRSFFYTSIPAVLPSGQCIKRCTEK